MYKIVPAEVTDGRSARILVDLDRESAHELCMILHAFVLYAPVGMPQSRIGTATHMENSIIQAMFPGDNQ